MELFPLHLREVESHGVPANELRLRGGFPPSLRSLDERESFEWRADFIKSSLERDVPMFAPRLPAEPKLYVRDSGIVHALLGIDLLYHLLGHAVNGPSWEGFVIENCLAAAGPRRTPSFYRTEDGAEVDLVFERDEEVEMAIEIKRSAAPVLSKGFRAACAVLRPKERDCVHGGSESWPMSDGVSALSLSEMLRRLHASTSAG